MDRHVSEPLEDGERTGWKPCEGTHTVYDQGGNVVGTERLANVVMTESQIRQ